MTPSKHDAGSPEGGINAAGFDMLTMALETIDEAVGIYDPEDRLVAFNKHYVDVRSAIGGHVVLGSRWEDLVSASVHAGRIQEAIGREEQWLEERRRLRGCYSIIRKLPDGRCYQVNERRMPNGGVAVVWTNITALVTAELQLETEQRRTFEQLLHMSRLSTAGQMASMLVHEMNQPLAAIVNYLSALRRSLEHGTTDLSRVAGIAALATEQSLRAGELLRRLRSFLTRHEIDPQPTDLNVLVVEALEMFAGGARMAHVRLEQALTEDLPAARADRVLVQQVIVNLMKNAVEAMEGSVGKSILITTQRNAVTGMVELRIADTGPGIAPDIAARLFEPFATTKTGGMGLGLSICRQIIQEHGGTLHVEANSPTGALFVVALPAA